MAACDFSAPFGEAPEPASGPSSVDGVSADRTMVAFSTDATNLALQVALLIPILAGLLGLFDSFRMISHAGSRAMVEVVLHEGRNHIVRRLLDAVGHPVQRLVRTAVGPVLLALPPAVLTKVDTITAQTHDDVTLTRDAAIGWGLTIQAMPSNTYTNSTVASRPPGFSAARIFLSSVTFAS